MNLREAREAREKTLKQVADAVLTDVGNLSRIESGQIPKKDLMQRLIDFYAGDVSVASFYDTSIAPPSGASPASPAIAGRDAVAGVEARG